MKADEYIAKFPKQPDDEHLIDIATGLIEEINQLIKARNARSPRALIGIFNELNQKWKAILRRLNQEELENVFKNAVGAVIPAYGELLAMNPYK